MIWLNKQQVNKYIKKKYKVEPDYPWPDTPNNQVFRHKDNNKWFGLIMEVLPCKLGLEGEEYIDILDIKCEKDMVFSLTGTEGYFLGYHMNKANWITVVLDDRLSEDTIKSLIDMSYGLTESKKRGK